MTQTILCVGALTMDTIFRMAELPSGPGKFLPQQATENAAGMASSAAASIARLGGKVALWASIGDDLVGERAVAEMAAEGVDCSNVRRVRGAKSAFSTILVDAAGERIIVPYYDTLLTQPPSTHPVIERAHLAAVMTDVRWPDAAEPALKAARAAGLHGILDADVAPAEILERLLPLASHIVASEPAATSLSGTTDLPETVRFLAEHYSAFVAVTGGEKGCYWFDRNTNTVCHMPAFDIKAVDTLAAGDVFHGAFALGLVEGRSIDDIIAFASAAAAIKCSRFGGRTGAPSRVEVEALLAKASRI